jgi:ribosomal protein L29
MKINKSNKEDFSEEKIKKLLITLEQLKAESFALRIRHELVRVQDVSKFKKLRKQISQIWTFLREQELKGVKIPQFSQEDFEKKNLENLDLEKKKDNKNDIQKDLLNNKLNNENLNNQDKISDNKNDIQKDLSKNKLDNVNNQSKINDNKDE